MDITDFRFELERHGLKAGLEYLNRRVTHRFTAVYRFKDMAMNVQEMVDKENHNGANPFALVPIKDSFCELAMDQGQFVALDSMTDERLDGNPYQHTLGSYVGLPLEHAPGDLYGTLCHYDLVPRPMDDAEFAFLQKAARLLPMFLAAKVRV
jgi:GAF domain-containing protein